MKNIQLCYSQLRRGLGDRLGYEEEILLRGDSGSSMFFSLVPRIRYPRSLETVELVVKLPGI